MKIVTVNVPESYIEAIEKLTRDGTKQLYPSRSELIRVAVREFLIREIKNLKKMGRYQNARDEEDQDEPRAFEEVNVFNDERRKVRARAPKREPEARDEEQEELVHIPIKKTDGNGQAVREFKTYKIIKKLS